MKIIQSLCLLAFSTLWVSAQNLPHRLTDWERQLLPSYQHLTNPDSRGIVTPPTSDVRAMAEWEEIDGLVITWTSYIPILRQIVDYAQEECIVHIVCSDSNSVKSNLQNNGVGLHNIIYHEAEYNSIWARDYAQWNVYKDGADSLYLVDWIYNRPRPDDNLVPEVISDYTGLPLYQNTTPPWDLVHTGGNFMVDGWGTGFASKLVLDENWNGSFNISNHNETAVDNIMEQFMGIDRFIKFETLPYDGIHHIDMHMKLLDEETVLLGEYPNGTADGPQIEANLAYLQNNFNSVWGTPYQIVRVEMPPDGSGRYPDNFGDYRTYTNSVFINKTVLVPVYEPQYDNPALEIYRKALPGYKVYGIDCNSIIQASGALHCITKAIGTTDPLVISHQPLADTMPGGTPLQVDVRILHKSGIQQALVHHTNDTTQTFQTAALTLTNAATNTWSGNIPAQSNGSEVFYYVSAQATSGKQQVRPMPAPQGWWHFRVVGNVSGTTHSGIDQFDLEPIFPNPSHGLTCIPLSTNKNRHVKIDLSNSMGQHIITIFEGHVDESHSQFFINSSVLPSGVYHVIVQGESEMLRQQFVVR